jgi:hypothetical protein
MLLSVDFRFFAAVEEGGGMAERPLISQTNAYRL